MTSHPRNTRPRRTALRRALAAGAVLAAGSGFAVGQANAATAGVQGATLMVTGDGAADRIALRLEPSVPTNLQVDFDDDGSADVTVDRATFDQIVVDTRRGNDRVRIDDANGPFTDTELTTIYGGKGDDVILGGLGVETFIGGGGNDIVDGNAGNDVAFLGGGNDTFIWDPGDGSDRIEGQRGYDTMDFRGSGGSEVFDVSDNNGRLRFFRNLGNIVMDANSVEAVKLTTLGGSDTTTVNDMRRTDVRKVYVDLAGALGVPTADGQADAVVVNATPGDDTVVVRPKGSAVAVHGLAASVWVANADPTLDSLTVNAIDGNDTFTLGKGVRALIKASVNA